MKKILSVLTGLLLLVFGNNLEAQNMNNKGTCY